MNKSAIWGRMTMVVLLTLTHFLDVEVQGDITAHPHDLDDLDTSSRAHGFSSVTGASSVPKTNGHIVRKHQPASTPNPNPLIRQAFLNTKTCLPGTEFQNLLSDDPMKSTEGQDDSETEKTTKALQDQTQSDPCSNLDPDDSCQKSHTDEDAPLKLSIDGDLRLNFQEDKESERTRPPIKHVTRPIPRTTFYSPKTAADMLISDLRLVSEREDGTTSVEALFYHDDRTTDFTDFQFVTKPGDVVSKPTDDDVTTGFNDFVDVKTEFVTKPDDVVPKRTDDDITTEAALGGESSEEPRLKPDGFSTRSGGSTKKTSGQRPRPSKDVRNDEWFHLWMPLGCIVVLVVTLLSCVIYCVRRGEGRLTPTDQGIPMQAWRS